MIVGCSGQSLSSIESAATKLLVRNARLKRLAVMTTLTRLISFLLKRLSSVSAADAETGRTFYFFVMVRFLGSFNFIRSFIFWETATRIFTFGRYIPIYLWFRQKSPNETNYHYIPSNLYIWRVYRLKWVIFWT